MTATTTGAIRNCPACNARNTRFSLFCAECGTSLNGETVAGETAAFAPLTGRDDAQQTSAFEPASRDYGTDAESADAEPAEQAPADRDYRPYWEQSTPTTQASDRVWSPVDAAAPAIGFQDAGQGKRGLVLGLFAAFLMLVVFLLWTWAALLDQGSRDSIRDFFGFIG
jgi:hypothetical protein